MENSRPATPILEDIAAELDAVGADLASLQARPNGDPFAAIHAYAAILTARSDLNQCFDGLPAPPIGDPQPVDVTALMERLGELIIVLGCHAKTSEGMVGLTCARAALHVDDALRFLAGDAG